VFLGRNSRRGTRAITNLTKMGGTTLLPAEVTLAVTRLWAAAADSASVEDAADDVATWSVSAAAERKLPAWADACQVCLTRQEVLPLLPEWR